MTLTAIGEENYRAFSSLLLGADLLKDKMYIGAIEDEKAVGAGVFSSDGNTLVIDSIFVASGYRRRGIAKAMMNEMVSAAGKAGADGLWVSYVDEETATAFLKAYGLCVSEDFPFYRVPLQYMTEQGQAMSMFEKVKEKPGDKKRALTFDKLSATQQNIIKNRLVKAGLSDVDDMIASLSKLRYSIALFKDEECKEIGAVIIADVVEDYVVIKYLANMGGNPRDLVLLLKSFWEMIEYWRMTYKILEFCSDVPEIKRMINSFAGYEVAPAGRMMVAYKGLKSH